MTDIDAALRGAFARAAEPGDPAGVVEALRARMAAGDTGTPAATSGFGARRGWWWPYVAGAVVLGVVGGVLGASGAFTATTTASIEPRPVIIESSAPSATPTPTPTPTVSVTPSPTPVATEAPAPAAPPPAPAPIADTTGPTLGGASSSPDDDVCADDSYAGYYAITSTISVAANDNVGVAGVHITWSGAESGSGEMSSGASWSFTFNPTQNTQSGTVTFTLVARDAAGNTSAPSTTTVEVIGANGCLI